MAKLNWLRNVAVLLFAVFLFGTALVNADEPKQAPVTEIRGAESVNADRLRETIVAKNMENDWECHPNVDESQNQYIIGYGSLMQTASRLRTTPNSRIRVGLPVKLKGFERGWFVRGSSYAPATYLGASEAPDNSNPDDVWMNAILYKVASKSQIKATDRRERGYCRTRVNPERLVMLATQDIPLGEIWIYVVQDKRKYPVSVEYPIIQSYMDIFLSGCLEVEATFEIDRFSQDCIRTTTGWSEYWVNDRLYPRRPFLYQPQAIAIDLLLEETVPDLVRERKIE